MTKILLVEDDKNLREIYGTRLYAEGYDIISAGDGEEALATAIKERPDLIISDVMMPKISGFDMLDILRSTTETKGIRVIMMTALSSDDQRRRGESLGADRYLVKSQVGIEDVVRTVHEVLGDSKAAVAPSPVQTQTPVTPIQPAAFPAQPVAQPQAVPAPVPAPQYQAPAPVAPAPQPMPAVAPAASSLSIPPRQAPSLPPQPIPAPQPQMQQPVAPQTPIPQAQPVAQPQAVPAPAPQPIQQPTAPVQLPQPTAPFSTPRPLGLGDRIIQPLPTNGAPSESTIADRIQEALKEAVPPSQPATPTPPAPAPGFPPIAPIAQQPAGPPQAPPASGLSFEETPRQTPPQSVV